MKAAVVRDYGPPESVGVEELPDPVAGAGQVVVDIAAAAVNFPDVLIIANRYQISTPVPFTPGSEFAGVVRSVGDGVTALRPGDRVSGMAMVGGFAERIAVPAASLQPVPEGVDLVSAAALSVTYRTAYYALRSVAEAAPGEWVVVLGAAGGVGSAALDIASRLGCRTLAAVSSPAKAAVCAERGADAVVDYGTEDLKERIKALTGGGADVVLDPVGGPHAEAALRACRWGGRFVTLGFASGEIPRIPLNLVLLKGVVVKGMEVRTFGDHRPEQARRDEAELMEMVAAGMRPLVSSLHPLTAVGDALREVAERRSTGKVVVVTTPG